ncbi:MAG: DUF371 domain-containing protein [Methanobacteriales archaeon HGW-Methanobacteriales-1]|jgi:hypothetical protein|nr:MAG: DUF371 domain-containing protein [Methanobacteriales archaeon HGW-Methanobacteriales-1]
MKLTLKTHGHTNVTSKHKTTFEVTTDPEISIKADCIVGVASEKSMKDFSEDFKKAMRKEDAEIKVILKTKNAFDAITGHGHPDLPLDHPTDIVCRKSDYICGRTLMINTDKAACDLNNDLINDLKNGEEMQVEIIVSDK